MGNKKINIAKLLKNCPSGMELDCTMWENVVLDCIIEGVNYPIHIKRKDGSSEILTENGCFNFNLDAKCVIFPLVWNYGLRGYTHVKFSYGYTKRTMTFEIDSIAIGKGKTEWGAPAEEVFKIKLGKRI